MASRRVINSNNMEVSNHHGDSRVTKDNKFSPTLDDVLPSELERDLQHLEGDDYDKGSASSAPSSTKSYEKEPVRQEKHPEPKSSGKKKNAGREKVEHQRIRDEAIEARDNERRRQLAQQEKDGAEDELSSSEEGNEDSADKHQSLTQQATQKVSNLASKAIGKDATQKVSELASKAINTVSDAAASAKEKVVSSLQSDTQNEETDSEGVKSSSTNKLSSDKTAQTQEKRDDSASSSTEQSFLQRVTGAASSIVEQAKNIIVSSPEPENESNQSDSQQISKDESSQGKTKAIAKDNTKDKSEDKPNEKSKDISKDKSKHKSKDKSKDKSKELRKGSDESLGQKVDRTSTSFQEKIVDESKTDANDIRKDKAINNKDATDASTPSVKKDKATAPDKTGDTVDTSPTSSSNPSLMHRVGDLISGLKGKMGLQSDTQEQPEKGTEPQEN